MLFNSLEFIIFFPIVSIVYFLIPHRIKHLWLLGASYYFYMSWNPEYVFLLLFSTVSSWLGGLLLSMPGCRPGGIRRKWCLAGCIGLNLGLLFFFKYYAFAAATVARILAGFGTYGQASAFDILLPVGISFYTFQAVGYLIDIYRGEIQAEKNFLRYALFLSFFPQLVAGPIERSRHLMRQMYEPHSFDYRRMREGLLQMGWGFFQKLVIADRIALLVTDVYGDFLNHSGLQIALATVLFAFQIYCDFGGYCNIAVGAARVMGFALTENFKSPYYAVTVSEFWRAWHISLTMWFRDYLYVPLGGNRCGRLRKYCNIMLTFCVSGLWHGAGWNYVVWGGLNGLYQAAGDLTRPLRSRMQEGLHMRTDCCSCRLLQRIATFLLVDFSWLFFRADSVAAAWQMLRHSIAAPGLLTFFKPDTLLGIDTMSLSEKDFFLLLLSLVLLMLVDGGKRRKVDFQGMLARQNIWFRWLVYYGMIFAILILGVYGPKYDSSAFIYFQF